MAEILRVGDRSPRVAEARLTLFRLGFLQDYDGPRPAAQGSTEQFTDEETLFDPALEQVLRAFQQSRGIIASGVIDDPTLREMRSATYTLGARRLYLAEENYLTGDDVSQLQKHLQELGFYTTRIDGVFGPTTASALSNYQVNAGLEPDATAGPETIRSLKLLGRRITGGSAQAIREREHVRQAGPRLRGKRVVLDPALGAANRGLTVEGKFGPITEEEVLWDLAERIAERMTKLGMEVLFSRPRTDDPTPRQRAAMANAAGADIMISLQGDRYPNEKASGIATFYFGSEVGNTSMTGEVLSGFIQREITARMPLVDCGSHARTWELLRLTRMPTVEIVTGYFTNPHDVAVLTDPTQRDTLAEAVVVAVKRLYLLDDDTVSTGTFHFAELLAVEQGA